MRKKIAVFSILLGIVGVILTVRGAVANGRPTINLHEVDADFDKVGYFDSVEADISLLIDCFAMEVTGTKFGIKTNEEFIYIMPITDNERNEVYYIGVKVGENDKSLCDKIALLTHAYFFKELENNGTAMIHRSGFVNKMSKRHYNIYREWFEETGWFESEEEIERYALPILFDTTAHPEASKVLMPWSLGFLATGILLLLWGILPAKVSTRKKKPSQKRPTNSNIMINGVSYPRERLERVNLCVKHGAKDFAIDELVNVTGMKAEEADEIIKQWRKYYRD